MHPPTNEHVPSPFVDEHGLTTIEARHVRSAHTEQVTDEVIEEAPIALLYNGVPYAVMMATPCDLADFALGFSLTEGIVADPREFELVDILNTNEGVSLQAMIPAPRFEALQSRTRNLTGHSGCGLCGTATLEEASRPAPRVGAGPTLQFGTVNRILNRLGESQPLNTRSGGVHAAAFARLETPELIVREDVGRHNALDKLVGALARDAADAAALQATCGNGMLAITSRASHEIVHKAAHAGICVIAAISAPTSLAIKTADAAGITLIAFARGEAMNVYTHPHRIG